ncbi:MAG: WYL domain-containing protein, partial [Actinomycetota bacterium]
RVRLRLAPRAAWIIDRYPHDLVEPVEPTPGSLRSGASGEPLVDVVLPVASDRWLARLLVRLGPDATVVEPAALGSLGAELASTMLDRYR